MLLEPGTPGRPQTYLTIRCRQRALPSDHDCFEVVREEPYLENRISDGERFAAAYQVVLLQWLRSDASRREHYTPIALTSHSPRYQRLAVGLRQANDCPQTERIER